MSLKTLIRRAAEALGKKELKLNGEGRLDVSEDQRTELAKMMGSDLLSQVEESLKESEKQTIHNHKSKTMSKPEFKWKSVGSKLGVDTLEMSDEGVYLSAEQLDKIEAALNDKTAEDAAKAAQTKAEGELAAANTAKTTAEESLAKAAKALDDLAPSVKAAEGIEKKVEAVRQELAKKPAVPASGITGKGSEGIQIENPDPVNALAKDYFTK
jgi:hypothetical protein